MRAKVEESDTGFDALEIATPSRATIEELKIGGASVVDFIEEIADDRMVVRFPNHRVVDTTPVELSFEGAVLVYGTRFTGKVFDTQTAELPQPITAGDTSPDLPNNDLAVAVSLGETIVAGGAHCPQSVHSQRRRRERSGLHPLPDSQVDQRGSGHCVDLRSFGPAGPRFVLGHGSERDLCLGLGWAR